MKQKYEPYDLGLWLDCIDLNSISDDDAQTLSRFDLNNDDDLRSVIDKWIKPAYLRWDDNNKKEMLDILRQSDCWNLNKIKTVLDERQFPSGKRIDNVSHFLAILRSEMLH